MEEVIDADTYQCESPSQWQSIFGSSRKYVVRIIFSSSEKSNFFDKTIANAITSKMNAEHFVQFVLAHQQFQVGVKEFNYGELSSDIEGLGFCGPLCVLHALHDVGTRIVMAPSRDSDLAFELITFLKSLIVHVDDVIRENVLPAMIDHLLDQYFDNNSSVVSLSRDHWMPSRLFSNNAFIHDLISRKHVDKAFSMWEKRNVDDDFHSLLCSVIDNGCTGDFRHDLNLIKAVISKPCYYGYDGCHFFPFQPRSPEGELFLFDQAMLDLAKKMLAAPVSEITQLSLQQIPKIRRISYAEFMSSSASLMQRKETLKPSQHSFQSDRVSTSTAATPVFALSLLNTITTLMFVS